MFLKENTKKCQSKGFAKTIVKTISSLLAISASLLLLSGCSADIEAPEYNKAETLPSYTQTSFAQYIEDTQEWLEQNRLFITDDQQSELSLVLPREYVPTKPNGQGVLLVHGLGDSPYSFVDIATHLADQGYLVRTILLPGHASKVGDLRLPTLEDWQGVVKHHIKLLKQDTDSIWVGGYSTGANLVTSEAINDDSINGLLLFSPALLPNSGAVKFAGIASYFFTWADQDPEDNPLRYNSLPMSAAAVYYETSAIVREQLDGVSYNKPVFMLMSEGDKVISTQYAIDVFSKQMPNPNNYIVWQGEIDLLEPRSSRFSMKRDDLRISNGSHMGLLFSPNNPYYGVNGSNVICSNGQGEEAEPLCLQGSSPLWYSAWGYREEGKLHARLTYNPYFEQSMAIMDKVMSSSL